MKSMPGRIASGVPRANPRIRVRAIAFASGNRTRVRYTDGARVIQVVLGRANQRSDCAILALPKSAEIG
jgi:hypothetical protein